MASLIKIKRSEVSGNPAVLGAGELAYSGLADNGSNGGDRLYIGMGTETAGNAVNHVIIGGKYFTDQITAATALNTAGTIIRRDASGNFAANIITAALAGNADTATKWLNARSITLTGDATATFASVDGSSNLSTDIILATVNSDVGTFGSATTIPVLTVNAKGLVTGVTTASISTSLNVAGSSGTGTISLATDTLTIAGGTGVTSAYNNTTKTTTLSIGQAVGTTDDVTFNNVTVNGSLNSDDITAANISVAGNAVITGNLTVQGTTTSVNSTTVEVGDINLTLAKDAANAAEANGAGLTVGGAAATITYSSADNRWNLNKDLNVSNVYGDLRGNADTATKLSTARTITATGDATWTVSFDGSAAVSEAITLATVNNDVGTFGGATSIPMFTVNAKGLITAAGSAAVSVATTSTLGLASFDSTQFTVTAGAVTIATLDGGTY
jgi:hypothetical protein